MKVKVIPTAEQWHGVTYAADTDAVRNAISNAKNGDIIDLGGLSYTGTNPYIKNGDKSLTIINGIFDGGILPNNLEYIKKLQTKV